MGTLKRIRALHGPGVGTKCTCKAPVRGTVWVSLMGKGATLYCETCKGAIQSGPSNTIPEAKEFWRDFDPEKM